MAPSFNKPVFRQHYEKKPALWQCSITAFTKFAADKKNPSPGIYLK
tara:strand:+ start:172 stop:309 length:138 start_codon:yes stop_codon:yes gene_type:complete